MAYRNKADAAENQRRRRANKQNEIRYCLCGAPIHRANTSKKCLACRDVDRIIDRGEKPDLDMARHKREMDAKGWAYAVIKRANKYNRFKGE